MENEHLLSARIEDALRLAARSNQPKTVGFLSLSEKTAAEKQARNIGGKFCFYGGYGDAERAFFVALPEWCDDAASLGIVSPVTMSFRQADVLSHRDFLGALLSLGIKRESVGDILVESGRAVAFLSAEILRAVLYGLEKVGRVGVCVTEGFKVPLPGASQKEEINFTVASARLDSVVSDLVGTSRERAKQMIADGLVALNGLAAEKSTVSLAAGDRVTVRGYGRFDLVRSDEMTKKNRIILRFEHYL